MKSRFRRLLVIAMAIVSLSMALPSAFAEKAAPLPPGSNLFVFRDGLKYGFMNEWGEAVIPANFVFAREFSEGLAAVCVSGSLMDAVEGSVKDGLWGFIDPKGKLVIQASFADALSFSEGKASVRSAEKKLYGFIDKKGLWVLQPKYYSTGPFSEGFATVTYPSDGFLNDETWIRADGSELLPPEYAFFEDFKEGFGSKRGLFESPDIFSKTGEKVFSLGEVFLPGRFSEGLMVDLDPVSKLYGYRDTSFKFAIPCSWEDALEFHEGLAAVKKDGLYGFIDKTGSLVIQPQFASVPYGFSGGLAAVAAKKNYLTFSDFSYKQLEAAKGGLGGNGYDLDTASYGLRYGYIDKTGAWKISPKFYKADPFSRGVAKINEDSKADPAIHRYCLINSSGRYLKGSEALTTKTSMDFRKGAQTLYSNTKNKENWLSYVPDGLRMKAKEGRGVIIPGLYSTGTQFDCVIKSGSPKLAENSVYVDMQGGFGDICAQIAFEEQSYCIFWYKDKADKDIVPWTVSKAIKPAESNTISFSERNGYLTLSINGTQVSSVYHGYPVGDELFHFTVHIFDNCDVILQSVDITNTPPLSQVVKPAKPSSSLRLTPSVSLGVVGGYYEGSLPRFSSGAVDTYYGLYLSTGGPFSARYGLETASPLAALSLVPAATTQTFELSYRLSPLTLGAIAHYRTASELTLDPGDIFSLGARASAYFSPVNMSLSLETDFTGVMAEFSGSASLAHPLDFLSLYLPFSASFVSNGFGGLVSSTAKPFSGLGHVEVGLNAYLPLTSGISVDLTGSYRVDGIDSERSGLNFYLGGSFSFPLHL